MQNLLASALTLAAAFASQVDPAPITVVTKFVALVQSHDQGRAAAMLTADAQFGINDVGGPLNAATLPTLDKLFSAACKRRTAVETARRMPERPDIRFVQTDLNCPGRDGPATHEIRITFFVQGSRIAGFYIG